MIVSQSGKFPDGEARDEGKQEDHGDGLQKANHDGGHEKYARDGSYNQILHIMLLVYGR